MLEKTIGGFFKYLILIIFTISTGFLTHFVYKLNILEMKYFVVFLVILLLLWLLISFKLIRRKTKLFSKILFSIIALLLTVIYVVGIKYIDNTIEFVGNMTGINYETQKYSVMVLNNSNYLKMNDLSKRNIGFLSTNTHLDKTKKTLKEKSEISFVSKNYEDIGTMIASIYNSEISAVVLDDSYIELLTENNVSFVTESKVIYTYEVRFVADETENEQKVDIKKDPFALYISGSDSRTTVYARARSDVNIVAIVNPNTNKILLVSIPRDYYVQLHGTTGRKDKLTHAGIYGIDMSKNTIQDLLGININYYAKVSFSTVINVVDVIGGLDLYSDINFKARANKNCVFITGVNKVDGACALAFARERYAYTTGDRHRGENQQAVITAIINKLNNPIYLTKYNDILKAIDGSFETNMSYDEITSMVKYQLSDLKSWQVESISLDGTGSMLPTYSMGSRNLYVMIPNEQTVTAAKAKISEYLMN